MKDFGTTPDTESSSAVTGAQTVPMPSHTPGPWRVCDRAASRVLAGEDDTIASTGRQSNLRDQWEANAHLIAAAPDMLAALKRAREQLEGYERERTGETFNDTQINAAIAKAEGRS